MTIGNIPKDDPPSSGILYIIEMGLEEKKLVKVGVTCRTKVEDRITEILVSIWKRYRYFPHCYVKKFTKIKDVYEKEAEMHQRLVEYRYETEYQFSGCTEVFDLELDKVVELYEEVVNRVSRE